MYKPRNTKHFQEPDGPAPPGGHTVHQYTTAVHEWYVYDGASRRNRSDNFSLSWFYMAIQILYNLCMQQNITYHQGVMRLYLFDMTLKSRIWYILEAGMFLFQTTNCIQFSFDLSVAHVENLFTPGWLEIMNTCTYNGIWFLYNNVANVIAEFIISNCKINFILLVIMD